MIQLWRSVPVISFDAEATIALGRDRPELLAVARLAADAGRPIDGRDVAQELLAGLPDHIGRLVIDRCVHVGLLVRRGETGPAELSDGGRLALDLREVLVPEEGIYRFYLVDDPLIPSPLLHVKPVRVSNAPDARRAMREAKESGRATNAAPAPGALGALEPGRLLISTVNGSAFEVRESPRRGERGPDATLRLELHWQPGGSPKVKLTGSLPPPDEHEPALPADFEIDATTLVGDHLDYEDLWSGLVEYGTKVSSATLAALRRKTGRLVLPVAFASASDGERRSFRKDVDVPRVKVEGIGAFEPSRVPKIEVLPASESDAVEWCHWLQWDALRQGYATPKSIGASAALIRASFPFHSPRPMTHQQLLAQAQARRSDLTSWNVLAPADLGLWSNA